MKGVWRLKRVGRRLNAATRFVLAGGQWVRGHCPICARPATFAVEGPWLRDQFRCVGCGSIPRNRALQAVLDSFFPNWPGLAVHESSPGGAGSDKIARECAGYVASQWFADVPRGAERDGVRSEDLEQQTFADASFDLVVTQDVFEHVLDPRRAFAEVARTLKPGGAHVFTLPWYHWKPTLVRASRDESGAVQHHAPPDYHGNPIDPAGSLVVTEWGADLCDVIYRSSGLTTTAVRIHDRHRGIDAEFIEVFISGKPAG